MKWCLSLIFWMLCIVACRQPPAVEIKDYPFIPMEYSVEQGDIHIRRTPMHTFHRAFRAATYTPEGEITPVTLAAILFPTDVIAIYLEDMDAPQVFLALAPNSG